MLKRIGQVEAAPPWGLFGAINTTFVPLVAVVAGTFIALALIGEPIEVVTLAAWVIGAAISIAYVRATRQKSDEQAALRLGTLTSRLLIFLLLGIGMAIVVDIIALAATRQFLPAPELAGLFAIRDSVNILIWLVAIVFMLVLQPVADELVFRGVFFPVARQVMGAWGGLVVSAMVYALFHYLAYPYPTSEPAGVWYALVSPVLVGLILGSIRANTGSTLAAIVAHAGFGLFALLKLIVL
jgi:membrane protease YdiL (CAAX protease family)